MKYEKPELNRLAAPAEAIQSTHDKSIQVVSDSPLFQYCSNAAYEADE
jgi:hypothetical protein